MIRFYWAISSIEFSFWLGLWLAIISEEIGALQYFPYDWLNDRNKDWKKSSGRQHNDRETDHGENYIWKKGRKRDLSHFSGNFTVMNLSKNDKSNTDISDVTSEIWKRVIELRKGNRDPIFNCVRSKRDKLIGSSSGNGKLNLKLLQEQKDWENQRFQFNPLNNQCIQNKSGDPQTFEKTLKENQIHTIQRTGVYPYKQIKMFPNINNSTKSTTKDKNLDKSFAIRQFNDTLNNNRNNKRKNQFNKASNKGTILNSERKIFSPHHCEGYKIDHNYNAELNELNNKHITIKNKPKFILTTNQSEVINSIINNIIQYLNNSQQEDIRHYFKSKKGHDKWSFSHIDVNLKKYFPVLSTTTYSQNNFKTENDVLDIDDLYQMKNKNNSKKNYSKPQKLWEKKVNCGKACYNCVKNKNNNDGNFLVTVKLAKTNDEYPNETSNNKNKEVTYSEVKKTPENITQQLNDKQIKSKINCNKFTDQIKLNDVKKESPIYAQMTTEINHEIRCNTIKFDVPIIINKNRKAFIKLKGEKKDKSKKSNKISFDFETDVTTGYILDEKHLVFATTSRQISHYDTKSIGFKPEAGSEIIIKIPEQLQQFRSDMDEMDENPLVQQQYEANISNDINLSPTINKINEMH